MKIIFLMMIALSLWAEIGHIMSYKGKVELQRNSEIISVKAGMQLLEKDTILTAKKSRVQVMLLDNTTVTVGANSKFSFEEFMFDGTRKSKISMRAQRGFFRSLTGKISKVAPERFKVSTATATIGIRGTDFSANILADKEIIKCYSGRIFVHFDGSFTDVEAGEKIEIFDGKVDFKEMQVTKKGTQVVEKKEPTFNVEEVLEDSVDEVVTEPSDETEEPFTIDISGSDREEQY